MDGWVLGLDGGGSKTALAYANAHGQVAGPYAGPGINPFDRPDWAAQLAALLRAHPAPGPLRRATLGLPGYGESERVSAEQRRVSAGLLDLPLSLMNDVEAAFRGAFPDGVGALLLCGTGSMAWASDGGRHVRAGGWGEGFGDEGSAYWTGREALSLASQGLDGRHPDRAFAQALLRRALGLDPARPDLQAALLEWYYAQSHPRSAVAGVARQVQALAAEGQPTAQALLRAAAGQLARHVRAVRAALNAPPLPWSHAGGALRGPVLLELVTQDLGEAPRPPALPPLGGALWHAAALAYGPRDSAWAERVGRALAEHPA